MVTAVSESSHWQPMKWDWVLVSGGQAKQSGRRRTQAWYRQHRVTACWCGLFAFEKVGWWLVCGMWSGTNLDVPTTESCSVFSASSAAAMSSYETKQYVSLWSKRFKAPVVGYSKGDKQTVS